jgi:AcrR family transcriptional regulator
MPAPAQTSMTAVVAAGRRILEQEGHDGLTMQRVATAVGVRAPSLYKRVADRGDLIRLILEDVARELTDDLDTAATSGEPRQDLRALATAFRGFAHARPAAYALLFAPHTAGGPRQGTIERSSDAVLRTAAALAGADSALPAARTVVAWAHGFVSMELAGAFRLGGDVDEAWEFGLRRLTHALESSD